MSVSDPFTLPCGLVLPNRVCKAAMAENMAVNRHPDQHMLRAYGEWSDGGWGMIQTGNVQVSNTYLGAPLDVTVPLNRDDVSVQDLWKEWAATAQRSGTPTLVQLCHPGRQSPWGAGDHGLFDKTIAPSAVKLNLGPSYLAQAATSLLFGTPREMTIEEISGPEGVIAQFVAGATQAFDSGFKGAVLHGAHGYLIAQFLSPKSNMRRDEFGGTAAKRADIVVRIVEQIRAATSKEFCIGMKMNSVDAAAAESLSDVLEQVQLIIDAGIDFLEISGGTYENPVMLQQERSNTHLDTSDSGPAVNPMIKASTLARESFFLEFASTLRSHFPKLALMVTGGFRTRAGITHAVESNSCDIVGLARPAAILPRLPKEILFNENVPDDKASLRLKPVNTGLLTRLVPIKALGAGAESLYYCKQIQRMGKGLQPIDCRV